MELQFKTTDGYNGKKRFMWNDGDGWYTGCTYKLIDGKYKVVQTAEYMGLESDTEEKLFKMMVARFVQVSLNL